jgi:hypothetical protein
MVHGAILDAALGKGRGFNPERYNVAPCSITVVKIEADGRGELLYLNQTEHLRML